MEEETVSINVSGTTKRIPISPLIMDKLNLEKGSGVKIHISQVFREGKETFHFVKPVPMTNNVVQVGGSYYVTLTKHVKNILNPRKDDVLIITIEKYE